MNRKKLSIIILLVPSLIFSGCGSLETRPRQWTEREKDAAGYFIFAHAINAISTEYHQDRPDRFHEVNPILGRHPSDRRIAVYFNITAIAALFIAHFMPEYRERILWDYGNANMIAAFHDYRLVRRGE